jgi:hypothetical protein
MWYFSSQLIKRPLLKETCILPEMLQHKACKCFKHILSFCTTFEIFNVIFP